MTKYEHPDTGDTFNDIMKAVVVGAWVYIGVIVVSCATAVWLSIKLVEWIVT